MKSEYYLSDDEVKDLREDFKSAMSEARNFIQEKHCECVFTKEEIERLVDLIKQPSYRMPNGMTKEEKRMFILNTIQKEGER